MDPDMPPIPAGEVAARLESAMPARRVLVVDDDQDNAEGLAMLCQLSGHDVAVAYDGPTAIEKAKSFRPDVVVLDLGLPGMDGIDTCRELRRMTQAPRPVVIAVTGWALSADDDRTRAAGFDHHFVKPVEPQQFLAMLSGAPPAGAV